MRFSEQCNKAYLGHSSNLDAPKDLGLDILTTILVELSGRVGQGDFSIVYLVQKWHHLRM